MKKEDMIPNLIEEEKSCLPVRGGNYVSEELEENSYLPRRGGNYVSEETRAKEEVDFLQEKLSRRNCSFDFDCNCNCDCNSCNDF